MLNELSWTDLGANATIWGKTNFMDTCKSANANTATRNDYILANNYVFPFINDFYVEWDINVPTHAIIGCSISTTDQAPKVYKNLVPPSLYDTLWDKFVAEEPSKDLKKWHLFLEPLQAKLTAKGMDIQMAYTQYLNQDDSDGA